MSGHTKEPWLVHHDIDAGEWPMVMAGGKVSGVIVANVNPISFSCATAGNVEMPSAANASRIVVCVNACAGMDDPAAEIDQLRAAVAVDAGALAALLAASDAVIERWHTPLWKDAKPTAEYIAALRAAADDTRRLLAGGGE